MKNASFFTDDLRSFAANYIRKVRSHKFERFSHKLAK